MARGVNNSGENPTLHGEIACMNDYVRQRGNQGWAPLVLYTTAEPCSMCMSALVWAGVGGVVFGTSVDELRRVGIDQIAIAAKTVVDASPFHRGCCWLACSKAKRIRRRWRRSALVRITDSTQTSREARKVPISLWLEGKSIPQEWISCPFALSFDGFRLQGREGTARPSA
jgi:tRNA(Arg) A34 adenosine deaminase TadA